MFDAAKIPLPELALNLLLLLRSGGTGKQISEISAALSVDLSLISRAADHLQKHGCHLETTPESIKLISTGWPWWRGVLEAETEKSGRCLGRHVLVFEKTASTNDVAIQAAAKAHDPLVVLADVQTRGRGRRENRWFSPAGQGVLMSVLLPNRNLPDDSLTLSVALACAEALERLTQREFQLKWPNDVLFDHKKAAGILIETRPHRDDPQAVDVVIGIGVNVLQKPEDFPTSIAGNAISLDMINPGNFDRLAVIDALLDELEKYCLASLDLESLVEKWRSRCTMLGQMVRVNCGGVILEGRVADVDPMYGLVLRDGAGAIHFCRARETTVLS